MTYAEKLKDPRWQKKRLEVLDRDSWACTWCGDTKTTLHVHHEAYIGSDPWDTPDYCLATVCEDCHSVTHLKMSELEKFLLEVIRQRDRGNIEMIRLMNTVVKRMVAERS